ncbi:hypothetical protein Ae201684_001293 [Aphanomyces euteiches]|uniref:Leucine-rich repeat-containing N-terminal plant-type domain-containing protein n=1 Tax=Aphanomyces euteiches TaxID=100861 RepID=A0A6G0XUF8_9STRA|nr:hypothetical protein Ae201684_001293 [Aphanomyces euteiches]
MQQFALVLVWIAAVAESSLILTQCWTQNDANSSSVPCLNNTANGTVVYLPLADNQTLSSYSYANLNISDVQDLPPNAKWIDLSQNNISQISCRIPSSLKFLNLSYNTLRDSWIQTPNSVTTLDVSYNQGGLPWIENIKWATYFPNLYRLVFRGNNLTSIRLGFDTYPPDRPFALDLSANPISQAMVEANVYNRLSAGALTLDPNSYIETLRACGGDARYVQQVMTWPTTYLPQGEENFDYSTRARYFYVCVPGIASYAFDIFTNPTQRAIEIGLLVVGCCFSIVMVALVVFHIRTRWRERHELYLRGTTCSSHCSVDDMPSDPAYHEERPVVRPL